MDDEDMKIYVPARSADGDDVPAEESEEVRIWKPED